MERHSIDEQAAFAMLRNEARRTNRKMVDLANAVVGSHRMLAGQPAPQPSAESET